MAIEPGAALGAAVVVLLLSACREAPAPDSGTQSPEAAAEAAPGTRPLVEIMQGLERDLAVVAHGIWVRDTEIVREGAAAIADHPRVPLEQMATVQAELGEEFGGFVQLDRQVHDLAVELAAAAEASPDPSTLFATFIEIQQGCMSCHAAFQTRVSEALGAAADRR